MVGFGWGCWRQGLVMARTHHYPSDLTDAEWAQIEPELPAPSKDGRHEAHPRREIVNAILYVARNSCSWRALPSDFPPWETVYGFFRRWRKDGTAVRINAALRRKVRLFEGRDPEPSAGVVDSQSVKGAPTVGRDSRGYDAGKKVNGRKRFVAVDTLGLLLAVLVRPASVQDRDGGRPLLVDLYFDCPSTRYVFADGGFAGGFADWAGTVLRTTVDIVRKPAGQRGFSPLPKRWVVERTLAWVTSWRRLARDYERRPDSSESFVYWAMIGIMARRLARHHEADDDRFRKGDRELPGAKTINI
ncbi:transposase, IS4 family [Frankia torreyi]|uniref:Transposase, IS4 family n=1 Tax=Frankia torreyi TaxID=1856 RepID=A0A0D8BF52_9ACTN|nr:MULTISPECIES: IS5 family transposase [Frankia]KJE22893.1 transposase, IS4 family [Frankia torreyi]